MAFPTTSTWRHMLAPVRFEDMPSPRISGLKRAASDLLPGGSLPPLTQNTLHTQPSYRNRGVLSTTLRTCARTSPPWHGADSGRVWPPGGDRMPKKLGPREAGQSDPRGSNAEGSRALSGAAEAAFSRRSGHLGKRHVVAVAPNAASLLRPIIILVEGVAR